MIVSYLSRISIHHPSSRSARDTQWNRYVTGQPRTHYVDLDVRLTYKRRYARSPPFFHPLPLPLPPSPFHQHVLREYYVLWCGAIKPEPPPLAALPPHHQRPHGLRTCRGGASLCLLLPPPTVYPFVHSSKRTHLDRLHSFKSRKSRTVR